MAGKVNYVPEGFHQVTPYLTVSNVDEALSFYQKAFGATLPVPPLTGPGGGIIHAEFKIGDSPVMITAENPDWGNRGPHTLGGSPVVLHLYVKDADAVFERAVAAGAEAKIPPADQFYGDRAGRLQDPFGHIWVVATHKEDMSAEEMQKRCEDFMAEQKG